MQKNKIFIDMNGRAGNQLFQYAFARKININGNYTFVFDFHNVINKGKELNSENTFIDYLSFFNVQPYESVNESGFELKTHGSKKQKRLLKRYYFYRKWLKRLKIFNILQKYQYKMQKNGIYKEDEFQIRFFNKYKKDIFVKGYFEDPHYFDDIKHILVEEFTPKMPKPPKNKQLYDIIHNTESVCVSIRVWNEISSNKELVKQRDVCNEDYYQKAIKKMLELHPNAVFVVFSNDIEFVKTKFFKNQKVYYEDGNDEVYEKLRLMSSCKHFIMSTSTFSWWAQYLSTSKNKTVISPDKWFADNKKSMLISEDWIKIRTKN